MPLPTSRNRTYDKNTPVASVDLNQLQDGVVRAHSATEGLIRNGIGHAAYEAVAGVTVPIPLRGACQFPAPASTSSNRIHSPAGWAAGPTVPTFATASATAWSGAVDLVNNRALIAMTSTSSIATRLCRWNAGAWATADLPVSYLGAARAAFIGTQFFVAQADGAIYRSTTGATGSWTAATALPANTDYRHLDNGATNGTIWIGCRGGDDTPNAYILRTADGGSTWSAVLLPGTSPTVQGVAWDPINSRFVAVGVANSAAAAWVSTDGTAWTALTLTFLGAIVTPTRLNDVVQIDGILVSVEVANLQFATSRDGGVSWSMCTGANYSAASGFAIKENGSDLLASSVAPGGARYLARF